MRNSAEWKAAAAFVMPWGKYAGQSLDDIARTDRGLLYLDWLAGRTAQRQVSGALRLYLADPETRQAVARAMADRSDERPWGR